MAQAHTTKKKTTKNKPVSRQVAKRKDDFADLDIIPVGKIDRPRSWALYGRSGSGKTTLAASFPKPILVLDIRDQGTDSIADHKDIDVKEVEALEDIEDIFYALKANPGKYKTVVIDTVTQLQQMLMEEIKPKKGTRAGDWGSISRREFGDVSAQMKEWILNFRNLGIEVVFIAQERTSHEDEDNSDNMLIPEVGPSVMPSVAILLNASVSIIGNTFIRIKKTRKEVRGKKIDRESAQYCLRIGPNPVYTTKLRKPKSVEPPAFIENPTYEDIMDIILGEE